MTRRRDRPFRPLVFPVKRLGFIHWSGSLSESRMAVSLSSRPPGRTPRFRFRAFISALIEDARFGAGSGHRNSSCPTCPSTLGQQSRHLVFLLRSAGPRQGGPGAHPGRRGDQERDPLCRASGLRRAAPAWSGHRTSRRGSGGSWRRRTGWSERGAVSPRSRRCHQCRGRLDRWIEC